MNTENAPSQALITSDGKAMHIGNDTTVHPAYGTPSFELRAELVLTPEEAALYKELTEKGTGVARLHIRSALAQLGVDAFHPAVLDMRLEGDTLVIETLITSFNGETGMAVIERMRRLIAEQTFPRIMHAGLFPHVARVGSAEEVKALVADGSLRIGGTDIYPDGSIGLTPAFPLYRFRTDALDDVIDGILTGEGRSTLMSLWENLDVLPSAMRSREFIVTGVEVETTHHHVVLRREVLTDGVHAEVVHGESCILQAGRTRGGSRQLELWNANGHPQRTDALRIVADLYKASAIAEPGH